jgi:hypothetical protein
MKNWSRLISDSYEWARASQTSDRCRTARRKAFISAAGLGAARALSGAAMPLWRL